MSNANLKAFEPKIVSPRELKEKKEAKKRAMVKDLKPKIEEAIKIFNTTLDKYTDIIFEGSGISLILNKEFFFNMKEEFYESKPFAMTEEEKNYVFETLDNYLKNAGWIITEKKNDNKINFKVRAELEYSEK